MTTQDIDVAVRVLYFFILGTAIVGLMGSSYALADYIADRLVLNGHVDERITANIGIRTSAMLALVFVLFVVLGIFAVVGPAPMPGREVRALVSSSIFEAIVLALTVLKLLNVRDRVRLLRSRLPA